MFINTPSGGMALGQFIDNVIDNMGRFGISFGGGRGGVARCNVITRVGTTTPGVWGLALSTGVVGAGGFIVEGNVVSGSDDDNGIYVGAPNSSVANNIVSDMGAA